MVAAIVTTDSRGYLALLDDVAVASLDPPLVKAHDKAGTKQAP